MRTPPTPPIHPMKRVGLGLSAVWLGLGSILLTLGGIVSYQQALALDDHGITMEAQVVTNTATSGKGGRSYTIYYAFDAPAPPGAIHVFDSVPVTKEEYDRFPAGTRIPIQYLPENPHVTRMRGTEGIEYRLPLVLWPWLAWGVTMGMAYSAITGKGIATWTRW